MMNKYPILPYSLWYGSFLSLLLNRFLYLGFTVGKIYDFHNFFWRWLCLLWYSNRECLDFISQGNWQVYTKPVCLSVSVVELGLANGLVGSKPLSLFTTQCLQFDNVSTLQEQEKLKNLALMRSIFEEIVSNFILPESTSQSTKTWNYFQVYISPIYSE